jgi:hypothetical protein
MKRILCQLIVGLLAPVSVVVSASWVSAQEATVLKQEPTPANRLLDLQPLVTEVPQFDVGQAPAGTRSLLKSIIVEVLPAEFEETKKWGGTKRVWDGLHMRMDGLQLRTKRRWKEVNHGTWKKHKVTLVDPDQFLRAKVSNIQRESLGKLSFDLLLAARMDVYGRLQEWQRGVRLFSISADATADVEIDTHFTVETKLDGSKIPLGVIIKPRVETAEVRLLDFDLHRISKADGPVVDELGDSLKRNVRKELAKDGDKIVQKINRQLEKKEDDLHLSVQDLIKNKWLDLEEQ